MKQNRINMNFPLLSNHFVAIEKLYSNAEVGIVWASIEIMKHHLQSSINSNSMNKGKLGIRNQGILDTIDVIQQENLQHL